MKRKLEDTVKVEGHKKPNLNKKSPQTLNLTAVCTLTQQNELTPFCLHAIDDYVLMRTKTEIDVMKLDKVIGDQDSKFRMTSTKFKGSTYDIASTLKVNQKSIFTASNHQEKIEIMLSPQLFPNCVLKSHQPIKCLLSPCSSLYKNPIIASLSSHGSLQLSMHMHDTSSSEVTLGTIAELSEIRKNSFSLENFTRLSKLQTIMDELTFSNFDWCPVLQGNFRFIAAIAKTNEIIIYSVGPENEVAVQQSLKFGEIVSELKWVVANGRHFLFVASSVGSLARFSIVMGESGKVESIEKVDEIKGELKIHISNIQSYCIDDSIVLLCAKSHSLEIFLVTSNDWKSITKYVGMNITGVTSVSNTAPEYLITTLNNKIYYLKFSSDLVIEDYQQVDNATFMGLQRSKFSAYGIAASRNKVLIYTALYPQMMFDHLVLKQPSIVSICILSKNNPYKLLLENKSLRLTGMEDCVEVARFQGSFKLESLTDLEDMDYDIGLDEKFLYYLKIQLIVMGAKLLYYQSRSDSIYESLVNTMKAMRKTVAVMQAYFLLNSLVSQTNKPSVETQTSMRCLASRIRDFTLDGTLKEPFKSAQKGILPALAALLQKYKISPTIPPETCLYCDAKIDKTKLMCDDKHLVNRCVITNLQIPVSVNHCCLNCNLPVADRNVLKEVTGKEEQFCPFCDRQLTFN